MQTTQLCRYSYPDHTAVDTAMPVQLVGLSTHVYCIFELSPTVSPLPQTNADGEYNGPSLQRILWELKGVVMRSF